MNDNFVYLYLDDIDKICYVGRTNDLIGTDKDRHKKKDEEFFKLHDIVPIAKDLSLEQAKVIESLIYLEYKKLGYTMINKVFPNYLALKRNKEKLETCPICEDLGCNFTKQDYKDLMNEYKAKRTEYNNNVAINKGFESRYDYLNNLAINRGFESYSEYQDQLVKDKGFESFYDYQQQFAINKGFNSYSEYENQLAKNKGFKNIYEYQNQLAKNKGFKNHNEYRNELAKNKGFENCHEYNIKLMKDRGFKNSGVYRTKLANDKGFKNRYQYDKARKLVNDGIVGSIDLVDGFLVFTKDSFF
jgi:hypothetical protein